MQKPKTVEEPKTDPAFKIAMKQAGGYIKKAKNCLSSHKPYAPWDIVGAAENYCLAVDRLMLAEGWRRTNGDKEKYVEEVDNIRGLTDNIVALTNSQVKLNVRSAKTLMEQGDDIRTAENSLYNLMKKVPENEEIKAYMGKWRKAVPKSPRNYSNIGYVLADAEISKAAATIKGADDVIRLAKYLIEPEDLTHPPTIINDAKKLVRDARNELETAMAGK